MESNTDSLYFSISRQSLDDCLPDLLKEACFKDKIIWVPAEACSSHTNDYFQRKIEQLVNAVRILTNLNIKRWVR